MPRRVTLRLPRTSSVQLRGMMLGDPRSGALSPYTAGNGHSAVIVTA
jgi:hypothetical protein